MSLSMQAHAGRPLSEKQCERFAAVAQHLQRVAAPSTAGPARATGTVKCFSAEKGFGSIAPDHQSKDGFLHPSAIAGSACNSLAESAKIQYEVHYGPKRP